MCVPSCVVWLTRSELTEDEIAVKVLELPTVTLEQPLRGDEGALFAGGTMMLEGEATPLLPASLEILSPTDCRLSISEGRYHQVRRMFAATGNLVTALHRDRIGGFDDRSLGAFGSPDTS